MGYPPWIADPKRPQRVTPHVEWGDDPGRPGYASPSTCRYCALMRDAWIRNPDCTHSDPEFRPIRVYGVTERRCASQGGGERTIEALMVESLSMGRTEVARQLTAEDVVNILALLDEDQAAYVEAKSNWCRR